jgi:hypothetical protein
MQSWQQAAVIAREEWACIITSTVTRRRGTDEPLRDESQVLWVPLHVQALHRSGSRTAGVALVLDDLKRNQASKDTPRQRYDNTHFNIIRQ